MKPPLRLSPLSKEQLDELKRLYRTTKDVRLLTRSQMILLAAKQGMTALSIAQIVRESDQTVRNWFKRCLNDGVHLRVMTVGPWQPLIPAVTGTTTAEYTTSAIRYRSPLHPLFSGHQRRISPVPS